jgi:hypothetical protein
VESAVTLGHERRFRLAEFGAQVAFDDTDFCGSTEGIEVAQGPHRRSDPLGEPGRLQSRRDAPKVTLDPRVELNMT